MEAAALDCRLVQVDPSESLSHDCQPVLQLTPTVELWLLPVLLLTPTVRLQLLLPPLQKQQRLPKRPRLDLCAMHCIENTAMQKAA
jgi:hypothetical protein